MGTYLYAVATGTHPLMLDGLVAVGAQAPPDAQAVRPRVIRHCGLAAIVSDAPAELRAKRRDLEAHERVLEALCADGTVLPMRFGVVAEDDDAVRRELESGRARYARLLDELDGHLELNVKCAYHEDAVLAGLLSRNARLRARNDELRAAGTGSYQERLAFGEAIAAELSALGGRDAEQIVARLRPYAKQVRQCPRVDGCFVNASFLVMAAAVGDFERAVFQLREAVSGYADVRLFGPLPPYSFVSVNAANG